VNLTSAAVALDDQKARLIFWRLQNDPSTTSYIIAYADVGRAGTADRLLPGPRITW
jgi:hypothetical protein